VTQPEQPGPLALGLDGNLYIADDTLNEVLELLPDGTFQIVAGTGTPGYSGDGGPAVDAKLNRPLELVVSPNRTLYIADNGNNVIRAVSPDGIITTVAGNGSSSSSLAAPPPGTPALSAALGQTSAVAIGPQGDLYIAASNEVLRLQSGELYPAADATNFIGAFTDFPGDDQADPNGIAFDGSGDLYMTCTDPYELLELESNGTMVDRGSLRPHDADAAITPAPDDSVVTVWQAAMLRVTATAESTIMAFFKVPAVGPFWPQDVAVTPTGSIYADQDGVSGIGPPAIIELAPSGTLQVLWTAAGQSG